MPDIYQLANQFRRAQLRNERAAASEMVRVYGGIWKEIDRQIKELTREYYRIAAAGGEVQGRFYQVQRLQALRSQVEGQLTQAGRFANTTIQAQQWQALQAGAEHAQGLLQAAGQGVVTQFNMLPANALAHMIGYQQEGSPLLDVLNKYAGEAAQGLGDALIQGMALGQGPASVARFARKQFGMALWQALRLARTETLRAYRAASLETYRANADIVEGWVWLSARNTRTCGMCWAMDGTFHKLDDSLDDHPNGRCTQVPKIKGMDLPLRQTGVQAFEKLRNVDKLTVLGPAKFNAYREGKIQLTDLVGLKNSRQWGPMRYEKSLSELGLDYRKFVQKPGVVKSGLEDAEKKLTALTHKMMSDFEKLSGTPTRWGGVLKAHDNNTYSGVKLWTCEIGINARMMRAAWETGDWNNVHSTLVHEMFHSVSPGLTPANYLKWKNYEEPVVEMMQRLHGRRLLKKAGELPAYGDWAYNNYIGSHEITRKQIGMSKKRYYGSLMRLPLEEREEWVYNQVRSKTGP